MNQEMINALFVDHENLAKKIANDVLVKFRNSCTIKLEKEDIDQEAMLALYEAAQKYDGSKGLKFSTYAYWCIRGHLYKIAFRKSSTIRLPRMDNYSKEERINMLNKLIISSLDYKSKPNDSDDFSMAFIDNIGQEDDNINHSEIKVLLEQILAEDEKAIVDMIYFEGMTQNDAADVLGLSHTSMNKKHKKIINKIRAIVGNLSIAV